MSYKPSVYGSVYVKNNGAATVIGGVGIANKAQYTGFAATGPSNLTVPSAANDDITTTYAGDYLVMASITARTVGAGADQVVFSIWKNNGAVEQISLLAQQRFAGGGADLRSISISGIETFAAGDTVELWLYNQTAANNILITDCNLTIKRIS